MRSGVVKAFILFVVVAILVFPSVVVSKDTSTTSTENLKPGTTIPLNVYKVWELTVGVKGGGLTFHKTSGPFPFIDIAPSGYRYVRIPVSITNVSSRTDSLSILLWKLFDNNGLEYSESSFVLKDSGVPPGATRKGYIEFLIKENPKWLLLRVSSTLWFASYLFD